MNHWIKDLCLAPHPEGGYFREIFRSGARVESPIAKDDRAAVTQIYFLLEKGQVSRFHRVIHDEIWHSYDGAPLRLLQFDGLGVRETIFGPGCPERVAVVSGGHWQAAETTGDFSLCGCTVAPGFEFSDFGFLANHPDSLKALKRTGSGLDRFI